MKRFLSVITPGRGASLLGIAIAILAFAMGILEMLFRNYPAAQFYLYLSMGALAYIVFLKYLSVHATFSMAEDANQRLRRHLANKASPKLPSNGEVPPEQESEVEVRTREKAEMVQLASDLRQALDKIQPESPVRPKYEATIEMLERVMRKQQQV